MDSLTFIHAGVRHTLGFGDHYAAPRAEGFRDTPASELQALVAEIESGRPWRESVDARYAGARPWLHRIITAGVRTAFFDGIIPPGNTPVLDIGAGWGQIARPLARHRPVVALEPMAERLAFIRAAARQEGIAQRVACLSTDYFDVSFETRFEVICAIGVLEWAGAFQPEASDPQACQRAFLAKTRRELIPGGALVLGIENRIGLKYLLGAPDDHIGLPGIASLPAPLARERFHAATGRPLRSFTYSEAELTALLRDAGFTEIEFWGAFPDYKLPEKILPLADAGRVVNSWLQNEPPPQEHDGHCGDPLPPALHTALTAHYRDLAHAHAAHPVVPSFFVRAR